MHFFGTYSDYGLPNELMLFFNLKGVLKSLIFSIVSLRIQRANMVKILVAPTILFYFELEVYVLLNP